MELSNNQNSPDQSGEEGANFNQEEQESAIEGIAGEESGQNDQQPLTTQGTDEERLENLSGTTSLSLEQLKKEGDSGVSDPNT